MKIMIPRAPLRTRRAGGGGADADLPGQAEDLLVGVARPASRLFHEQDQDQPHPGDRRGRYPGKDETKITEVNTYSNLVNIIDKYMYYINQNEEGNVQTYRINVNGENNQAI